MSLVLPLRQQDAESSSRALPVRFELAPVGKHPAKKAGQEVWVEYHREEKEKNLARSFVALARERRERLKQTGHRSKRLVQVGDGSLCNRTVLREDWESQNVTLVVRCRKDIGLCQRAPGHGPRFHGETKFTPEQVRRRSSSARWQQARIFHGGCFPEVRYKDLTRSNWQGGSRKREVRLLVVASTGYRTSQNGRQYYRQPACLLITDLTGCASDLLQAYFDRWDIEVHQRDEQEIPGVGEAQVWKEHSVSKVPARRVARYSGRRLAGLPCYGPTRTQDYLPLPQWRRGAKPPSCLDLVTWLRRQIADNPPKLPTAEALPTWQTRVTAAAAQPIPSPGCAASGHHMSKLQGG